MAPQSVQLILNPRANHGYSDNLSLPPADDSFPTARCLVILCPPTCLRVYLSVIGFTFGTSSSAPPSMLDRPHHVPEGQRSKFPEEFFSLPANTMVDFMTAIQKIFPSYWRQCQMRSSRMALWKISECFANCHYPQLFFHCHCSQTAPPLSNKAACPS